MTRIFRFALPLCFAVLLHANQLQAAAAAHWTQPGSLAEPRSGSAAAVLSDGRVLITGGTGSSGPLATTEFFNTDGSFSAGAPMQDARANHTAVVLQDGRVLVAGGTTTGGAITNTAEIYDPSSNKWTLIGSGMAQLRSGHSASLLSDGRVLIAGGQNTSGPANTLEIFSPSTNSFTLVTSGTLSSARTKHAAAVLADGRVLIAGGSDGTNALKSVDIFDPSSGNVSPAASMSMPRAGLSATTLLDGTVLVAGGNNGSADLSSAEKYDPAAGSFSGTGNLSAARSGHLAFLLPNNNEVLIAGGTSAGTPLASAELFVPWTGSFSPTGAMAIARTAATGGPLKQNGQLLVAGGSDGKNSLASSELYNFATIATDKSDYPPGTTVNISGSGWQPGETVTLTLVESPLYDTHGPYSAVADSNGNIFNNQFVTDEHDANIRFYLTAKGSVSQAQMTFTDSSNLGTLSIGDQVLNPNVPGESSYVVGLTFGGSGDPCTAPLSIAGLPSGSSYSWNPDSSISGTKSAAGNATLIVESGTAAPGSYSFTVTATSGSGCNGNGSLSVIGHFTTGAAPAFTSANSTNFTVGTGGSFTVTATGSPTPKLSESGTLPGGVAFNSATGVLSGTPTTAGTYPITFTATNGGGSVSQSFTLAVSKGTATVTLGGLSQTYDGTAKAATATTSPAGLNVSFTYNGSSTPPTAVGSYAVLGTVQDNNYQGTANGTLVIGKASATVTLGGLSQTYDGAPKPVSATTSPVGLTVALTYNGSGTAPTAAGTYSVAATIQDTNYQGSATGTLVIGKAPTVVTWPTPADISYGTALSSTQLNATANVPGTFLYNPSPGTVLSTGNGQTLSVTFTPNDPTDYAPAMGSVHINVLAATPGVTNSGPGTSTYGTNITLSVTLSAPTGAETPTGTVQFQFANNGTTYNICSNGNLQTQPNDTPCTITLNNGTASVTTSSLPAGTNPYTITAKYTPADSNYQGTSTTISYTVNTASTHTSVEMTPATGATYGDTVNLSSTVTNAQGSTATPTGAVQFQYSTNGGATWVHLGDPVTLDTTGKAQTTTTALPAGKPAVEAEYIPDNNFATSASGPAEYTVNQKALTVSGITASNKPYDGKTTATLDASNAHLEGVIGSDDVELVTTGATGTFADANVGTGKTVTADGLSLKGTAKSNYTLKQSTTTANIAAVQVTVTAPSQTVTYGDPVPTPLPAPTYNTFVNGEDSSVLTSQPTCTTTYTQGSPAGSNPTTTCSGAVAMNYTFTYVNGTITVDKANAKISVTPYSVTYDAKAHTATGTAKGVNGQDLAGLDLSKTTHTDAGTYANDAWAFTDTTGNYNNSTGTVSDAIAKADAKVTVTGGTYTYDTTAHPATAAITGVQDDSSLTATMVTLSYTPGDAAAPVNAGKYTATGTFAGNQNYNAASGTADIVINKADAKVAVTGGTYIYDANPHPATATVTGVTGDSSLASVTVTLTYAPGDTAPVNAGSYKATGTFAGNQNYNSATGSDTITINKADAKVTVTPYSVTYDATAHTATGTAKGVKEEVLNGLDLSATTHTNAGTTTDTWTFTDATGNYNNTSGTVSDTIAKANVTVTVNGGTFIYNASAHPATANIAGVTGDTSLTPSMVNLSYDPGGTAPVNAGSYTATGTFAGNPNYNSGSGTATITINKATPALTVEGGTYTYNANPHPGIATITGVPGDNSLASLVTLTYAPGGTAPVNAGTYQVTASFAANANYNSVTSAPASIFINQASATINVLGYTGPYDGAAHGATGSAAGVVGENLTSLLNFGNTFVHVPGGTANWSFAGNNNYKPASGTAAISLFAASTNTALTSVLGQSSGAVTATLTAAVASAAPLGAGTVTFTDGSNNNAVLGTSGLTAGKASITIQTGPLAAGPHVITATYAPSSLDFAGSASASTTAPGVTITSPSSGYVNPITSPVNFSATLSGVAANINPCACAEWTWTNTGSNASTIKAGTISGTTITGSNTFASAGVFGVTLTFTDGFGGLVIANTVSASGAPANLPATVVIYDASAGFVTGGGWINSPLKAYTADPEMTGKATFGFVSKYQKGATVPTGDTQFTFQVGKLDFHSTSYQWLVISGPMAQYKGSGTINGSGNYDFMLTARDGSQTGNNTPDGFRIKITDPSKGGTVVYDNLVSTDDAMTSGNTQNLDGGSVIVHSK